MNDVRHRLALTTELVRDEASSEHDRLLLVLASREGEHDAHLVALVVGCATRRQRQLLQVHRLVLAHGQHEGEVVVHVEVLLSRVRSVRHRHDRLFAETHRRRRRRGVVVDLN